MDTFYFTLKISFIQIQNIRPMIDWLIEYTSIHNVYMMSGIRPIILMAFVLSIIIGLWVRAKCAWYVWESFHDTNDAALNIKVSFWMRILFKWCPSPHKNNHNNTDIDDDYDAVMPWLYSIHICSLYMKYIYINVGFLSCLSDEEEFLE